MNWLNLDLSNDYHRNAPILDEYNFDKFLTEIYCNVKVKDINPETLRKHFHKEVENKVQVAYEIFEANIQSLVIAAKRDRVDVDYCPECNGSGRLVDDDATKETIPCNICNK